jgi:hypothetical protein
MSLLALEVAQTRTPVHRLPLLQCCNSPSLHQESECYRVQSNVSPDLFRDFLSAIEGHDIKITIQNFSILSELSTEFGFTSLLRKLETFSKSSEWDFHQLQITLKEQSQRLSNLESVVSQSHKDISLRLSVLENLLKSETRSRRGIEVLFGRTTFYEPKEEEKLSERLGLSLLCLLADSGNADAEYESGRRFIDGRGCEPDNKKGVSF